ncbi:MAG: DMT family transporter [Gammaproteobacteria bacterium]|jgi:drug/metabolite transporter (DMT)-like permease|nr:EamA family transporter [Chromatiales bacterium]MCP4925759.1 DMT family transporter [Gammaproteobacteria bacterium]MDP7154426.1 DMT family transporter [Gammaproteobacteria bacterium]MDP7295995.1 DMT family transporter [Gammaproteobacteria bacterium]MDP7419994.1 DMT family transporter [Gammaproteobacteria bacterium]
MTNFILYFFTVLIWGATWLAVEFQLGDIAPEVSLVYRYLIATAVAFAWCALTGRSLRFDWRAHRYFMLMGVFLFGLNYVAAYAAQIYIMSALNAIGFSAMVWLNIINTRIFLGAHIDKYTYLGATLGIIGILIIFLPAIQNMSLSDNIFIGASLSLTGALLASFGNIIAQVAQRQGLPVMPSTAWGMFYGVLLNTGLALAQGKPFDIDLSPAYLVSLLFLAVFGSVVAFGCYLTLLGRIGADRAGYSMVMIPIVALILSAMFENLVLELHILIGVALALTGNIAILASARLRSRK